jgi:hypothetical protein
MSFHISFAARTVYEARSKLQLHHAPAAVKALIEKALDAIPAPKPEPPSLQASTGAGARADVHYVEAGRTVAPQGRNEPAHFGVFVEVWGHIADAGDGGTSEMQRFVVKPLAA